MDYRQFRQLMGPGGTSGKDSIPQLQEFVNEFPYFQTAHALLAKAFHDRQHVRYDKQLKMAAIYAGDRKVLYQLIHKKAANLFTDTFPDEKEIIEENNFIEETVDYAQPASQTENIFSGNIFSENYKSISIPEEEAELKQPEVFQERPPADVYSHELIQEDISDIEEAIINRASANRDPHDIIRERLKEILGTPETAEEKSTEEKKDTTSELKESDYTVPPVQQTDPASTIDAPEETEIYFSPDEDEKADETESGKLKSVEATISKEAKKAIDDIDRGELEYALEATILHSIEHLPEIQKAEPNSKPAASEPYAQPFLSWLKSKNIEGFGKIEIVHADEEHPDQKPQLEAESEPVSAQAAPVTEIPKEKEALIERFIANDPRIIPSKAEFYSPVQQAKKSITEDEDLVSETLARIYQQQGNYLKSRSAYQKLSLLHPEKKAYFAALIKEIEGQINNLEKEDL
jgi:hypothetical protein